MRRKLVVGNWKMNGRIAQNQVFLQRLKIGVQDLKHADVVVCVPYPYIAQAQALLQDSNVAWGAQNLCADENVALTGAVSAYMLTDYGCSYVIVGHSERRTQFHETDDTAATRFDAAEKAGLIPIFCMGESAEERESDWTEYVVGRQLDSIIRRYGADVLSKAVLAYEPLANHGNGMNVLFADGRVEWIDPPRGRKLLAELDAGYDPPRDTVWR